MSACRASSFTARFCSHLANNLFNVAADKVHIEGFLASKYSVLSESFSRMRSCTMLEQVLLTVSRPHTAQYGTLRLWSLPQRWARVEYILQHLPR